jgi:hypothetical protein
LPKGEQVRLLFQMAMDVGAVFVALRRKPILKGRNSPEPFPNQRFARNRKSASNTQILITGLDSCSRVTRGRLVQLPLRRRPQIKFGPNGTSPKRQCYATRLKRLHSSRANSIVARLTAGKSRALVAGKARHETKRQRCRTLSLATVLGPDSNSPHKHERVPLRGIPA